MTSFTHSFSLTTHTIICYDTKARTAHKRATKNSNKKMWPREHVCALTPAHVNEKGDVQLYSAYSYALKHKHTSTETLTRTQISPTWHESPIRFCKYVYEGLVAGFPAGALGLHPSSSSSCAVPVHHAPAGWWNRVWLLTVGQG